MISFTETDFNLPKIWREAKLFNLTTRLKFHFYGLRQQNNPAVLIEYNAKLETEAFVKRLAAITDFFKANNIEVEVFGRCEHSGVCIGMRKDLRAVVNKVHKPVFAASILQTIIYGLEDRIDLESLKSFTLPNVPKLPRNNPKSAVKEKVKENVIAVESVRVHRNRR